MSGGWEGSDRKSRLPDDWPLLRQIVIERAGGRCEVVKRNGKRCWDKGTDVDHKVAGDDHSIQNLQLICEWHHKRKSSREGNAAKALLLGALKRPPEAPPGTITGTPTPTQYKGF